MRGKGNPLRRRLEYNIVIRQARKDPERLKRRLKGLLNDQTPMLPGIGNCLLWTGSIDKSGYGRINFTDVGDCHVQIAAHRLFLIMMLRRPIAMKHDAGHMKGCPHRHCVRHVFEQPMAENYNTARGKDDGDDVPF